MDLDRGKPEYKLCDNIGDFSIRSYWYHNNHTKRNPGVMFRSHWPINGSSGFLPFTLQFCCKPLGILQKVTKSQKVHISSHDGFQKVHNINFFWHVTEFPIEAAEYQEFTPSPIKILRAIDCLFSNHGPLFSDCHPFPR